MIAKLPVAKFLADDTGATAIEYALIASIVSISIVAAATLMGTSLVTIFTQVATALK